MNIALDYDGTYTRDPVCWNAFIAHFRSKGHKVYCVTMRYKKEEAEVNAHLSARVDGIFFTARQAKQRYMFEQGISIDVWIDDMPGFITQDAADRTVCKHCGCNTNKWSPDHKFGCPEIPF